MDSSLLPFFKPRGVVVVGASTSPEKLGYGVARNLIQSGYQGAIHFVSHHAGELFGHPLYANLNQVPDPAELAILMVPPSATPKAIEDCGRRGVKAAVIVSSGFRESGAEGTALEQECLKIARAQGVRLLGPNCIGTRGPGRAADVALRADDLAVLERVLDELERERADDFVTGFIAERPRKLRRILEYYCALLGLRDYPPVRCNAPEFSAVVTPDGRIDPCFFIRGPERDPSLPFDAALNHAALATLRADVRGSRRPECRTCVCSLWREPDDQAARAVAVSRPY